MRHPSKVVVFSSFLFFVSYLLYRCGSDEQDKGTAQNVAQGYLNLGDTAGYVGMSQCRLCHQEIYNSFRQTGMGSSFDHATKAKSAAEFGKETAVYDKFLNMYYHSYWEGDTMRMMEFRLAGKDTIHKRVERVDYIVGSGQHTNSHVTNTGGYLCQAPMTFYTQRKQWDLPPGFENGSNTRFSRKIGLECMSCHNAYPEYVKGSENKYSFVPQGIDCERCHGPGSIHAREKSAGLKVDTSRMIDYTIVNPAKLPIDLQFDVCQRCHLQGNAVLKEGKSFYDFKPGRKLSDVMTVFMPKYEGAEKEFIMASHADRLKMSQCFIKTFKPEETKGALRPYKNALTCVTCHDPHVSVKVTGKEVFNNACKNCHNDKLQTTNHKQLLCSENQDARTKSQDNCFSCHMPKSGAIDIPHVSITDHYIRKPVKKEEIARVKRFIGLFAINEEKPSEKVMAEAYINQLEKFDLKNYSLLDSALRYLPAKTIEQLRSNFSLLVRVQYLKGNYPAVVSYVTMAEIPYLMKHLSRRSWDNADAWTCYRVGEALQGYRSMLDAHPAVLDSLSVHALVFYKRAVELAPYNYEFLNKYGSALFTGGDRKEAMKIFEGIVKENPKFVPALGNLGYCYYENKEFAQAERWLSKAVSLDPDYERAVFNLAQMLIQTRQREKAVKVLNAFLRSHPDHYSAKVMLDAAKKIKA